MENLWGNMIIIFDRVQFGAIVVIATLAILGAGCAPVPLPKLAIESDVSTDKAGLTEKSSVIAVDSKSLTTAIDIQSTAASASGAAVAVVKPAVAKLVKEEQALGQNIKTPSAAPDITTKDAAVVAQPVDSRIEYTLAKKYYNEGRYESVIAVLESRIQSHSKDFKSIDLLVLTYTKFANRLVDKANLLEAKSVLEKAVSIQPGNKKLKKQLALVEKQQQAERYYQTGLNELKRGNKNKAFDAFNNVLLLKSNHDMAKQQIVKMKSNVVQSLHHKAMRLYKSQELELAIMSWDKVLKINPAHELARLYRGRAVELKKRLDSLPASN